MDVPGFVRRIFRRNRNVTAGRWPNPQESIGPVVVHFNGWTFWEAVGTARQVWDEGRLGDQVRTCITSHNASTNRQLPGLLIVDLYMVGRHQDTAMPKVFVRSDDETARSTLLSSIKRSGIMDNYPLFGLGAMPASIVLMATEDVQVGSDVEQLMQSQYCGPQRRVLALNRDQAFGRRLFVQGHDPTHLRRATGGPLLYVGGKVLQLTAGHAFLDGTMLSSSVSPEPLTLDNVQFDGMGDIEDDELEADEASSSPQQSSPAVLTPNQSAKPDNISRPRSMAAIHPATLSGLVHKGNLFDLSRDLDYALIELQGHHRKGFNRIASQTGAKQRFLYITTASEVGKQDVLITAITSSVGFVKGTLSATPSYLGFAGTQQLQKVFSVTLEGTLAQGDCGGPVVDRAHSRFYGHIVAGALGGSRAYIMPATSVMEDIEGRYGAKAELSPPGTSEAKHIIGLSRDDKNTPFQYVEFGSRKFFADGTHDFTPQFASREYFTDLEQASHYMKETDVLPSDVAPRSSARSSLPPSTQATTRAHVSYARFLAAKAQHLDIANQENKRKSTTHSASMAPRGRDATQSSRPSSSPGNGFATLPLELQSQILGHLDVPDILRLRLVSRAWNGFITAHDTDIAFSHLRQPHIPTFAINLFPAKEPSPADLGYVARLWHRYSVACRLSHEMSEWITQDLFLCRTKARRVRFAKNESLIRYRLVPFLLIVAHFLETYRRLLLHPSTSSLDHAALEKGILEQYDDFSLLQLRQLFPILMAYQARRLRPPSYLGHVERPLRGYLSEPPPDHVQIAMLYLGGLRDVSRLTRISSYENLCATVDSWYEQTASRPVPRKPIGRLRNSLFKPIHHRIGTATQKGKDTRLPLAMASDPTGKAIGVPPTSLASGPPMGPLTPDETSRVLDRLPETKDMILVGTAEEMLLDRGVVPRAQDIKKNAEVLEELALPGVSWLDVLFYERGINEVFDFGAKVESRHGGDKN
ncbi:hypothetical protein B0T18DRAFT_387833 [Schizothecium vesticola]|uniref:F-box domain-containing protein n=1 Tax=Schizothecium vesticola TaxID=314040 RepID=A0AA40F634_9PEZI|nr:hypothetical protein B0T18DRAFT_387833 [Schizothecium vesticola]